MALLTALAIVNGLIISLSMMIYGMWQIDADRYTRGTVFVVVGFNLLTATMYYMWILT